MGRACSGFFASSTLKHTPGAHRSACDPAQYARVRPNAINPLIRHPALKPGTRRKDTTGAVSWDHVTRAASPISIMTNGIALPFEGELEEHFRNSQNFFQSLSTTNWI